MTIQKISTGSDQKEAIRKQMDKIPNREGRVIFLKDGEIVESCYVFRMREIVYERLCGWDAIHRKANQEYADQILWCDHVASKLPDDFVKCQNEYFAEW